MFKIVVDFSKITLPKVIEPPAAMPWPHIEIKVSGKSGILAWVGVWPFYIIHMKKAGWYMQSHALFQRMSGFFPFMKQRDYLHFYN